jgi:excinuclease ABC subunit B
MYADQITRSMRSCIDETERRRAAQLDYNERHGITPQTVKKSMRSILEDIAEKDYVDMPEVAEEAAEYGSAEALRTEIGRTREDMLTAAAELDFEKAAELRDRMLALERQELALRDGRG